MALALTIVFLVVEAAGGWLSGSLALLADAGHMLTDAAALALAVVAQRIADKPRSRLYTFGFRRAEMLAALVNGLVLVATGVGIVVEALRRWSEPSAIAGAWMLGIAVVGLLVNLASAWVLAGGGSNANVRAALAHVLADALGSVAAIAAGAMVLGLGWLRADLVVSVVVAALVVFGAARVVRETARVLMEGAPPGVDQAALEATVRAVEGVADLHDLHAWTIADGFALVSVHVVLDGTAHGTDVAQAVGDAIREQHGIAHVTVQPESPRPQSLLPAARLVRRSA